MSVAAPRDLALAALLLVPVVAGAAFSLVRLAQEGAEVPREEDYVAVAAAVEKHGFQVDKDGLAVLPPWSLRPLVHLKRFRPMASDGLAERPLHRYARLFVVLEADHEPYSAPLFARLGQPALDETYGRVRLLRFDPGGGRVVHDFKARLRDAKVRIARRDGETTAECGRWSGSGWNCDGRKSWQRVEAQWQLTSENGQHVVWSHPPPKEEMLEIAWDNVALGDGLVFGGGHTRDGAASARAPIDVEVWVGEQQVGALSFPPQFGVRFSEVDTREFAGLRDRVRFRIHTEHHGMQHFSWDAWTFSGESR